jgi:SPP1 family phage portal protein
MITKDKTAVQTVTPKLTHELISQFELMRLPNLRRLRAYYDADTPISRRQRPIGAPNNKLRHPFARYLSTMASGYLVGSPVKYFSYEENASIEKLIARMYLQSNSDSIDAELALNASLYGVGCELVYIGENNRVKFTTLDPLSSFVVYDDTAEHNPVLGLTYTRSCDLAGGIYGELRQNAITATVYTKERIYEFTGGKLSSLCLVRDIPHPFCGVPIVEYWNDRDERGDIEPVLALLDAYDILMSDRLNGKQEFADSILVLTGVADVIAETAGDGRPIGRRLREDRALTLPDREAKVEWLTKQQSETDAQVLADALRQDIHKLALIPDLSDESFGGNLSGVAIKYRLLGMEQLVKIKERYFREGLNSRLRLIASALAVSGVSLDPDSIGITFTRSINFEEVYTNDAGSAKPANTQDHPRNPARRPAARTCAGRSASGRIRSAARLATLANGGVR